FMVLVPGSPESEAGEMPSTELLGAMTKYNEELVKAGVMLAGEGLHPTSKGAKVRFNGGARTVIDGPFTEAKEIVAGYWVWECAGRRPRSSRREHDGVRHQSGNRCCLADRVGPADRRADSHRARRGGSRGPGPGRPRRGARAVAGVGHPAQPGCLADGRREAP